MGPVSMNCGKGTNAYGFICLIWACTEGWSYADMLLESRARNLEESYLLKCTEDPLRRFSRSLIYIVSGTPW